MNGHQLDLKKPEEPIRLIRGALITDATPLYDAINANESSRLRLRDKRTTVEVLRLRELGEKNETELRWVNGAAQVADGVTKTKAAWMIVRFIEEASASGSCGTR